MTEPLKITIFEAGREVHSAEYDQPIELGRQDNNDGEIYQARQKDGLLRIPIARGREAAISRRQLLIESLEDGQVRLSNRSRAPVRMQELQSELAPNQSQLVGLPITVRIGSRDVRIDTLPGPLPDGLQSLAEAPQPPGARDYERSIFQTIAADPKLEGEKLIPWLQAFTELQAAAGLDECYERVVNTVYGLLSLDAVALLLLDNSKWKIRSRRLQPDWSAARSEGWRPSGSVLKFLRENKLTLWQPNQRKSDTTSITAFQALVAAPILDRQGEIIGAIYGERSEGAAFASRPVTQTQALLVQLLASGVAAEVAQRKLVQVERDLEIGRQIQAGFLPLEIPHVAGWEIAYHFHPAREVSGDFYDVFVLPGGLVALVVADVCNKGVGSALYMALFRSLLRAFAEQAAADSAALLPAPESDVPLEARESLKRATTIAQSAVEATNNYVYQKHGWQYMFCTLFFGLLDPNSGELTYVNGGHDAPALIGADAIQRLGTTGPAVGLFADAKFRPQQIRIAPGSILFSYTDGVPEARDNEGAFFTEDRLLTLLKQPTASARELIDRIATSLIEHASGAEPYDDVTMLAVRCHM